MRFLQLTPLIKRVKYYFLATALDKAIPFLTLPLLSYYLTTKEMGLVSLYTSAYIVFNILVTFSVDGAINVYYFKESKDNIRRLLFNAYLVVSIAFLVSLIGFFLFSDTVVSLVKISFYWILVLFLSSYFFASSAIFLSLLRVKGLAKQYGSFQVLRTIVDVSTAFILILFFNFKWESKLLSLVIANSLFGIISFYFILKKENLEWKIERNQLKKLFHFGLPLLPHMLSGVLIAASDKFFISSYVNLDEAGRYSVAYTLGMLIAVVSRSFNQAWAPYLFKTLSMNDETTYPKIVKQVYLYLISLFILTLAFSFISQGILKLFFNESYQGTGLVIFIISFSYFFEGAYFIFANFILFKTKTQYLAIGTILSGGLNLIFNYLLIKDHGMLGAALATLLSFCFLLCLTIFFSNKVFPFPWTLFLKKKTLR